MIQPHNQNRWRQRKEKGQKIKRRIFETKKKKKQEIKEERQRERKELACKQEAHFLLI